MKKILLKNSNYQHREIIKTEIQNHLKILGVKCGGGEILLHQTSIVIIELPMRIAKRKLGQWTKKTCRKHNRIIFTLNWVKSTYVLGLFNNAVIKLEITTHQIIVMGVSESRLLWAYKLSIRGKKVLLTW